MKLNPIDLFTCSHKPTAWGCRGCGRIPKAGKMAIMWAKFINIWANYTAPFTFKWVSVYFVTNGKSPAETILPFIFASADKIDTVSKRGFWLWWQNRHCLYVNWNRLLIPTAFIKFGPINNFIQVLGKIRNIWVNRKHLGMGEQLQLNLGKWEKLHSNLGEIKNIYMNGKHLGEVHPPN